MLCCLNLFFFVFLVNFDFFSFFEAIKQILQLNKDLRLVDLLHLLIIHSLKIQIKMILFQRLNQKEFHKFL